MRGRMFDPVIRRFLSPDPHVTNPLSGQSYNRYSYVLSNPTNLIDPTGFDCIGQECSGYGSEYSSSGFESSYGHDYSGAFTRVEPSAPSGFSGSAVGGNGVGAPVQAAERQRLVSMPTGPSAPAGAISGPTVNAGGGADKWNPYSNEGRIHQALFGAEQGWQDPLEPYKPALGSIGVSLIPGLNSYVVLNDPEASTASKVLAVGSDVLAVVGVGAVIKVAKAGGAVVKSAVAGAKAAGSLEAVRAYSVAFEMTLVRRGVGEYSLHFTEANEQLLKAMADPELAAALRQSLGSHFEGTILSTSGRALGKSPAGWTWHHVVDQPGVLQLVPRAQHIPGSPWQALLHPDGKGGMAIWGSLF